MRQTLTSPMNIWSGSREGGGLAAALTNPTLLSTRKGTTASTYPVEYNGVIYPDAETAYQRNKARCVDAHEADELMAEIIRNKFLQHPRLYAVTTARGGAQFLGECSHFTNARSASFQSWEGKGRESRFIRNLINGYVMAAEIINKEKKP